jgi:hypothetical protein
MSTNETASGNRIADADDLDTWMQFVDWESLGWVPDAPALAG